MALSVAELRADDLTVCFFRCSLTISAQKQPKNSFEVGLLV